MFKLIIILLILCCILVILYKTSTPDLDIIQEEFEDSFDETIKDVGVESQLSKIVNNVTSKKGFNTLIGLKNINSSYHSYLKMFF